jgi:hypothetical protein
MKIDKVIFCIDDNPHYKGFWPSISKHFRLKMNMLPKLFVLSDKENISEYDTLYGEVEIVKPLNKIPLIIQALLGKFFFTKTEPNTTWLIGDIDLYPLHTFHFTESIKNIPDEQYIHLNPYAYGVDWRNHYSGLAGYFHVAKGHVFAEELKIPNSFEDFCNIILNSDKYGIKFYYHNNTPPNKENGEASSDWGWFCCEEMYTGDVLKNSKKLIEIPPINSYTRINRTDMVFNENLIKNQHYIDFHAPRPYEQHEEIIERILSFFNP